MKDLKKYIAEFVGTMMLVLIGCGTAMVVGCSTPSGIIATALAFGLTIVAMAYSIGNVSGCHINPAVSIGMLASGKMKVKECVGYLISQFLGGIAGAAILGVLLGGFAALGANSYGGHLSNGTTITVWIALIVEVILTFVFVLSVLGVTDKKEHTHMAGLVIGLTLVLVHIIGISFTGTSVNPARSFGPALLQGGTALCQYWLFLVAPLIGAILSALFYRFVMKTK